MKKTATTRKIITALLGLVVSLVFLELCLLVAHTLPALLGPDELDASAMDPGVYRILCLGDSTTAIGGDSSWPGQLQEVLDAESDETRYVVINGGKTGVDSSDILAALQENLERYRPHLVIVMTGINENGVMMYRHIPGSDSFFFERSRVFKFFALMLGRILEPDLDAVEGPEKMYREPTTRSNFEAMAEQTGRAGIKLVAMQYPRRPVEPLKEMLRSLSDVTVVDNEGIFVEALERGRYEDYFLDRFAGDFGHCTQRGSRLLAGHLAQTLFSKGILPREGVGEVTP